MSNHLTDGNGRPIGKWQIRIKSEEPTLIEYAEITYGERFPEDDLFKLVRRTSYMVSGPHREVWWAVDLWDPNREGWVVQVNGKSRLKRGFNVEQMRQAAIENFPKGQPGIPAAFRRSQ